MITGPAYMKIPEKVLPLITKFNDYFYFLLEGGRGSGKTHSIARLIANIGEKRKVRVFCGRETQSTIEDSVYAVFCDIISQNNLNYDVFKTKIVHRTTGTEIRFKGFRENGSVNIKGLEKVDILWIDEAEAITQTTLDIIVPTIVRLKNFKMIFSMNRFKKSDAVYGAFANKDDCLHITVNYVDNPYISPELLKKALECKTERPDDYKHIWMGQPRSDADNYLFNEDALDDCVGRRFDYDPNLYDGMITGCDVARYGDNYSAAVTIKQVGPRHWAEFDLQRWKSQGAVYTIGRFNEIMSTHRPDITIVDADGLGGPVYDVMSNNRLDVRAFHGGQVDSLDTKVFKNWRTYGYLKLADMVNNGWLRITSTYIIDQLREIQYRYDITSRKYIIPKEQLIEAARKRNIKYNSPDEADALMMAATMIDAISHEKRLEFTNKRGRIRGDNSTYYKESDLY